MHGVMRHALLRTAPPVSHLKHLARAQVLQSCVRSHHQHHHRLPALRTQVRHNSDRPSDRSDEARGSLMPRGLDELKETTTNYLTLGKIKLTGLVSFTASVGFAMSGGAVVSLPHAAVALGTLLQSMSANTLNQVAERNYDKLMKRTERRPMVTGAVSPTEARLLAAAELTAGTALLYMVEPMAAGLGVVCWGLYVHAYTPMKRRHWLNTWVGAVVGAIPPVMGCVGAGAPLLSPGPIFLGAFLYFWQIPHFMSLCYLNRRDYKAAGFQMLSHIDTARAGDFSLRYSVYTTATAFIPVYYGICSPVFGLEALLFGVYWTHAAYLFKQTPLRHARKLFLISIAYLPILLLLLLFHCDNLDLKISPKLLCPVATE
eukprot:TRINITY_DN10190_c2_g1_i1.p1 TRINITY_DN10190_c2_g1~~TRINITY_DN10190_c2_g1_i1.p1  ORF type:complete len:373 (+),score=134.98 TRINITY_DN10190_c2_g1_i1:52-1170(+)